MIEIELKAVVDDVDARCAAVMRAGGRLVKEGRLRDLRFDDANGDITGRGEMLRVRTFVGSDRGEASLEWKGRATAHGDFKQREEIGTTAGDGGVLVDLLRRLGYRVILQIDRRITQYALEGATVRFERYPRMDDLVEVEGLPDAIERAVKVIGIPRSEYGSGSIHDFMKRYEQHSGQRAIVGEDGLPE
jgi:predicted adenylyl cyclase CyaB